MSRVAHQHWDQLAAGHALHALSEQDEQAFAAHAETCARCTAAIAADAVVTEELAALAPAVTPPPALRDRVLAMTAPTSTVPATARRRPPVWLAAAASVVALAVAVGLASQERSPATVEAALQACLSDDGCKAVRLRAVGDGTVVGGVLVRGNAARLVVDGLPVNDRAASTYVLWQRFGKGVPVALASFDVSPGMTALGRELRAPLDQTQWLAVSVERGRVAPLTPSVPVAVGVVSSS